jgi:hypothetical protein
MSTQELTPGCRSVLDQVARILDFLFIDYGFQLIHQRDAKLGERCLFVFESPECRLRVISEFGGVGLEIGTLEATTGWASAPAGKWEWFGMDSVLEFVRGVRPTLEEIRESGKAILKMSSEDRMLDLANRLRPVAQEVFDIFRADSPPSCVAPSRPSSLDSPPTPKLKVIWLPQGSWRIRPLPGWALNRRSFEN